MTSSKLYDQIVELAEAFKADGGDFKAKGNKAAGARARKATLDMCKLAAEYRKASVAESKK